MRGKWMRFWKKSWRERLVWLEEHKFWIGVTLLGTLLVVVWGLALLSYLVD